MTIADQDQALGELLRQAYTFRCADLYSGDGTMAEAILDAGLQIGYAYDPDLDTCEAYLERFDYEPFCGSVSDSIRMKIDFDLLVMRLTEHSLTQVMSKRGRKRGVPIDHALRLIQDREPCGILFMGEVSTQIIDEVDAVIREPMECLGYLLESHTSDASKAIVATRPVESQPEKPFPWPPAITPLGMILALRRAVLESTR